MTLEQCIAKFSNYPTAPNTGVAPTNVTAALLPLLIVIVALAIIFGIYVFRLNCHARRSAAHRPRHNSRRGGLLSILAFATILTSGLVLTTQSYAQTVPNECKHHVDNDDGDDNDDDPTIIRTNAPIQSVTAAQCAALPTYTGLNEDAIRTVTDNRGGTAQTYRIAKLADNNCWMLDNLKLGSTTAPITLTPADSNVASNFTLPQLNDGTRSIISSGPGNDYDTPYAYGGPTTPLDADPTYGYLYNFSAATAGETSTSHDENAGDAPNSICAAGWRLPRSGYADTTTWPYQNPFATNDFANLDIAFGGTGAYADGGESNIAQWQPTGAFKGTYSGYWAGVVFVGQGDLGFLWSASADPGRPDGAFAAAFDPLGVGPGDGGGNRPIGFGIRCLLQP